MSGWIAVSAVPSDDELTDWLCVTYNLLEKAVPLFLKDLKASTSLLVACPVVVARMTEPLLSIFSANFLTTSDLVLKSSYEVYPHRQVHSILVVPLGSGKELNMLMMRLVRGEEQGSTPIAASRRTSSL